MTREELEKEAEELFNKKPLGYAMNPELEIYTDGFKDGYNKAIEWFDARTSIPLPKKVEIYRYTLEVISDKGDIVCYDYKDKNWKKLVIEDEEVTYIPIEIKMWCNKPNKETE